VKFATQPLVPPTITAKARAFGRIPFGVGPRFFLLLVVGLLWIGPAWIDRRFLYALGAWDIALVLLWAWDIFRLPSPAQLEVSRLWNTPPSLSNESKVELQLVNGGAVPLYASLIDDLPPALRTSPATVEVQVAGRASARVAYGIQPSQRGDAEIGQAYVRYQTPLRVGERWAVADLRQVARVVPDLEEARRHTLYLMRSRQIEMEKRLTRYRGLGREFESLREYREGDDVREICWTATGRRAKLITRQFQIERSQAVWIVVDAGRLLRARIGGLSKLDYAVNAALTLAHIALYSGDRVGLLAYGRQVQQELKAARGPLQLNAFVQALAVVREEVNEADHIRAVRMLLMAQKRRSLIVWITDLAETAMTPDVIQSALQLTRRHLLLFAAIAQPEVSELTGKAPVNAAELYRYTAAQEMIQRRELLLRTLRQQGALALELQPGRLATGLVNQYLDVKERGVI
jgi:uncharacterized protein (DUF58 family)